MQWFLALNEGCPAFQQYAEMVRVAVHTALRQTSLRPHFLYDGGENELTRWLRDRDVPIIECRTKFFRELLELGRRIKDRELGMTAPGIFLRAELPRLREKLNLDERVFYTDSDVFFLKDPVPEIESVACKYFAVSPEFALDDYENMNTGAMWMNLRGLLELDDAFQKFILENLAELRTAAWDQGAYRRFFRGADGTRLWERLRPELNWKPYWGDYEAASIIHFHGPKPFQRATMDAHFPELKRLTGGCFAELCELWDLLRVEAR